MDVRGHPTCFMKALAISIVVAALCSGVAVPALAMPNMPHLFASEVARCGGDVAHASKHLIYCQALSPGGQDLNFVHLNRAALLTNLSGAPIDAYIPLRRDEVQQNLISRCRGLNPAAQLRELLANFDFGMRRFESRRPNQPVRLNASNMKVAQKPRRTARFRRYELISVCGIWQWRRHSGLLSQRAFFWCLVFAVCPIRASVNALRFRKSSADLGYRMRLLRQRARRDNLQSGCACSTSPAPSGQNSPRF